MVGQYGEHSEAHDFHRKHPLSSTEEEVKGNGTLYTFIPLSGRNFSSGQFYVAIPEKCLLPGCRDTRLVINYGHCGLIFFKSLSFYRSFFKRFVPSLPKPRPPLLPFVPSWVLQFAHTFTPRDQVVLLFVDLLNAGLSRHQRGIGERRKLYPTLHCHRQSGSASRWAVVWTILIFH